MPRPMRFILVALLLAIPGVWWLLRPAPVEPPAPSTASAQAPPPPSVALASQAVVKEDSEEDTSEVEDSEEEDPEEEEEKGTGPCISVEVTAHGAPVPGARVVGSRRDEDDSYISQKPLVVGPDGRGQAWCVPGTYLLAAQAPGFAPTVLEIVENEAGTSPLARFQLQPGQSVSGRVLDKDSQEPVAQAHVILVPAEGFPVEDSDVVLDETSATTDARGTFRVGELAEGVYRIAVDAPGHTPKETELRVPRAQPLTIELDGTCHLEGEVVDASGAPVSGAHVWSSSLGSMDEAKPPLTDAQGHFSLEVEEGTHLLIAKARGQVGRSEGPVTVARGGLVDGLVIRLRPSGSLSGKVFLQSNQAPVDTALVSVRQSETSWNQLVRTDEKGAFRAEYLLPGVYSVILFKSGLPQVHRDELSVEEGKEVSVELPVVLEAMVEGRVTDGLGRPAQDANISAVPLDKTSQQSRNWASVDETGKYQMEGLSPGRYRLEAQWYSNDKPLSQEISVQEGETAHADFSFHDAPGEVQGVVRRTSGGPPRYPVVVSAASANNADSSSESPDDSGHFTLKLMPGAYKLMASYSDTDDSGPEQPVTVETGKISRVNLTVPDTVTETTGIVLNSRGEPAAGASVSFSGDEQSAIESADEQGRFTFKTSQESAGTLVDIRAENDSEEGQVQRVRLGSGNIVVRLVKAAALRGRVVAARGGPIQGFELQYMRKEDSSLSQTNPSPFAGDTFELVDLPVGSLALLVRTSDGRCGKAWVQLQSGQTGNVEVSVGTLGRVTGRVVTATGEPRSGWVRVDPGTQNERSAYTTKDGHFELISLEPGPHDLDLDSRKKIPFMLREAEVLNLGDVRMTLPSASR